MPHGRIAQHRIASSPLPSIHARCATQRQQRCCRATKTSWSSVVRFVLNNQQESKERSPCRAVQLFSRMTWLFWRQFCALFVKNWIVISKHPFVRLNSSSLIKTDRVCQLNALRCFIAPIAYGVFLAEAQFFLNRPNDVRVSLA